MSLLFTDGFECFDPVDLWRKWGGFHYRNETVTGTTVRKTKCAIVSGKDPLAPTQDVARKGGRSLLLTNAYANTALFGDYDCNWGLFLPFEKSRTIYLGYALRCVGPVKMTFYFTCSAPPFVKQGHVPGFQYQSDDPFTTLAGSVGAYGELYDDQSVSEFNLNPGFREHLGLGPGGYVNNPARRNNYLVAKLTKVVNPTNISCTWNFSSADQIPMQVGSVNHNANAWGGDFYYYQHAITLLGNNPVAGNTSWVESRIGSRLDKRWFQQCQTVNPNSDRSYHINGVYILVTVGGQSRGVWLDDFYLANDAGDTNNTFLGPVFIRNASVQSEGNLNDGIPYNTPTNNRGEGVSGEFIRTRTDIVSETTLLGAQISGFSDPFTSRVSLTKEGDRQSFRFNPVHYYGSSPDIKACALYALVERKYADLAAPNFSPFLYAGYGDTAIGRTPNRPITGFVGRGCWAWPIKLIECRRFFLENDGQFVSSFLNAETLNNCEAGFRLDKDNSDPNQYMYRLSRAKIVLDETLRDSFFARDYSSRYIEELVYSLLVPSDVTYKDWGGSCVEDLIFFDLSTPLVPLFEIVPDSFRSDDTVPLVDITEQFSINFSDDASVSFYHVASESLFLADSSYGFWVEQFVEYFSIVSETINGITFPIFEEISVFVSDVFDNHLDASEEIAMLSSYVWDGHESVDEYLSFSEDAKSALLEFVDSLVDLTADHFDGNWVEMFDESFSSKDSVVTQQWRHEWFMGIIINSYQVNPIEDNGTDGFRVGDYNTTIFGGQ